MKKVCLLWLVSIMVMFHLNSLFATPVSFPDTIRVLALRVEFQPEENPATTGNGQFDLSSNSDPFRIDPPPHNRSYFQDHLKFVRNYFYKVSKGALVVTGDVFPTNQDSSYQLDQPMGFYNPNTSPEAINEGLATLLQHALQKADDDPAIDFSQYDAVVIFHAGVGRDIDLGLDNTPQDIPSLFITSRFLQTNLGVDGIPVDDGATLITSGIILPETESQEGLQLALNGMLVSNIGSFLGWLDLFSPDTRRSGVGRFGLMDAGLFNGDGLLPSLPSAWTRISAGWETPVTIYQAQADQFTVYHTLSNNAPRVFKVPINAREYFLVENRYAGNISLDSLQFEMSQDRNELVSMREVLETNLPDAAVFSDSTGVLLNIDNPDRGLPGGGILIWHIDETVIDANRAENRINADPNHRGVDLEEADGSQDIGAEFDIISGGAGSEIGTALDPWYADNTAPLFQADPAGEFSLNSIPNSRSYYNRANSHVRIYDFSPRDSVMTFRVDLNFFQANFPRTIDPVVYGTVTSLKAADVDNNGTTELLFTTTENDVLLMDQNGNSAWGSDSLRIIDLPDAEHLMTPPAIFSLSDGSSGICLLTTEGNVRLYRFNTAAQTVDSLFFFQCPAEITTFPILDVIQEMHPPEIPTLFWGCGNGEVYALPIVINGFNPTVLNTIPERIERLHVIQSVRKTQMVIVGSSGSVYLDDQQSGEVPIPVSQPVGFTAVAGSPDGVFHELLGRQYSHPEDGVFRFDSPVIAIPGADVNGSTTENYFVAGDNRLLAFNYNFSQLTDFPVTIYQPEQETDLFLSPLAGIFPNSANGDIAAVLITDPAGLMAAYDFRGNLLPDFPLAIGDSVQVTPAILDIDNDDDPEVAAVTVRGVVYTWDFSLNANGNIGIFWSQLYGDAANRNRSAGASILQPPGTASLLPAETVYNYPNPNIDNFTFIRYRLSEPAEVNIKIFDLAGDLVKVLPGTGNPGTDNEVRWDLTGVQTGVYFARVEAKGSQGTEVRIIKIAVVK